MKLRRTDPEIFIVESLDLDKERTHREGEILSRILMMAGKTVDYWYIRTKKELREVLRLFGASRKRYLHLSCHGNTQSLFTTLEEIPLEKFAAFVNPHLKGRRIFISACHATSLPLARAIIPHSGCRSLIGPAGRVAFHDAALMWSSFYHLMFKLDQHGMQSKNLKLVLEQTCKMFSVPMRFYRRDDAQIERTVFHPAAKKIVTTRHHS